MKGRIRVGCGLSVFLDALVVNVGTGNREKSSQHPTRGNQRTKKEHPTMKKKTAKQPAKPTARVKDLKPKKDAKGGGVGKTKVID